MCALVCAFSTDTHLSKSCPYEERYPESELLVDGPRKWKQSFVGESGGLISPSSLDDMAFTKLVVPVEKGGVLSLG